MSVITALENLRDQFVRLGVSPDTVEIVMPQPDVDRVLALIGRRHSEAHRSLQLMAGFLVCGEPHVQNHKGALGDLLAAPPPENRRAGR